MYQAHLFTKKPPPFKIYSGKDFIKDLFPGYHIDEIERSVGTKEEDEAVDDEENYNLYFSGCDIF